MLVYVTASRSHEVLSPIAADHVCNPRNSGPLDVFTHFGQVGIPGDGAFVSLWFLVEEGVVLKAAYQTHGCRWSIASASVLCQLVTNRPVTTALLVEPRDIDLVLGGIPEGKQEFPGMAIQAMEEAIGKP